MGKPTLVSTLPASVVLFPQAGEEAQVVSSKAGVLAYLMEKQVPIVFPDPQDQAPLQYRSILQLRPVSSSTGIESPESNPQP